MRPCKPLLKPMPEEQRQERFDEIFTVMDRVREINAQDSGAQIDAAILEAEEGAAAQ